MGEARMTYEEALDWKARMCTTVNQLRLLLLEGHERCAWEALRSLTWADCLEAIAEECTAENGIDSTVDQRNAFRNAQPGRPRQYASNADRQRAYRLRIKARSHVHGDSPLLAKLRWGKWSLAELQWLKTQMDSQAPAEVIRAIDAKLASQS
jgi:hypothetical protein